MDSLWIIKMSHSMLYIPWDNPVHLHCKCAALRNMRCTASHSLHDVTCTALRHMHWTTSRAMHFVICTALRHMHCTTSHAVHSVTCSARRHMQSTASHAVYSRTAKRINPCVCSRCTEETQGKNLAYFQKEPFDLQTTQGVGARCGVGEWVGVEECRVGARCVSEWVGVEDSGSEWCLGGMSRSSRIERENRYVKFGEIQLQSWVVLNN